MIQKYRSYYAVVSPAIIVGGFISACIGTYFMMAGMGTLRWPTAPAEILSSEMSGPYETNEGRIYHTDVWYEYWVNGERHVGNNLGYGDMYSKHLGQAEATLAEYPTGHRVRVRYRADSPDESVLNGGVSVYTFLPVVAGIIAAIAGVRLLGQIGFRSQIPRYQYSPKPPESAD